MSFKARGAVFDQFLEDIDLIQTQQLIFSNKPANSSNNRFTDAVFTTEFEKRISDRIPQKNKNATNRQLMYGCNGQSRRILLFCTKKRCIFFINDIDILKM